MIDLNDKLQIENYIEELRIDCKNIFDEYDKKDISFDYYDFRPNKVLYTKSGNNITYPLGYFDNSFDITGSIKKPKRLFKEKPSKGNYQRYLFNGNTLMYVESGDEKGKSDLVYAHIGDDTVGFSRSDGTILSVHRYIERYGSAIDTEITQKGYSINETTIIKDRGEIINVLSNCFLDSLDCFVIVNNQVELNENKYQRRYSEEETKAMLHQVHNDLSEKEFEEMYKTLVAFFNSLDVH